VVALARRLRLCDPKPFTVEGDEHDRNERDLEGSHDHWSRPVAIPAVGR